jgi:thiamine-phosphate pyrophosphorylase
MFGLSTHDPVQLEAALRHRPDYVAYGPVFGTQSKENPDAEVGLAGLRAAAHRVQGCCPLVAIGGITQATAREVGEIAELGSVIGALLPASSELAEVTARAEQLQLALGGRRG